MTTDTQDSYESSDYHMFFGSEEEALIALQCAASTNRGGDWCDIDNGYNYGHGVVRVDRINEIPKSDYGVLVKYISPIFFNCVSPISMREAIKGLDKSKVSQSAIENALKLAGCRFYMLNKEDLTPEYFSQAYEDLGFKNEPDWLFQEFVHNWEHVENGFDEDETITYLMNETLSIRHAETGADRELDFDAQAYFETNYIK